MRTIIRSLPAALLVAWAAAASQAAAQVAGEFQVTIRALLPVEALYLADLVPGRSAAQPDIFGITLLNPTGEPTEVVLDLAAAREHPDPIEILRGSTHPFILEGPIRQITNRHLTTRGGDVALADHSVSQQAAGDPALRSGRLPAGTYRITVTLRTPQGQRLGEAVLRLTLAYPTRVTLLSPGAELGAPPPVVPDATPRFLWSGDGDAGGEYRLRVVPVDDAASGTAAMQAGHVAWETVTLATSALYPASAAALRLEPGGTYAWQVTRELRTSGGVERIESPIHWFRVAGTSATAGALHLRLTALLRALGLTDDLAGFVPVSAVLEDGRAVSLPELEALLGAIQSGEVPLLSVRIR